MAYRLIATIVLGAAVLAPPALGAQTEASQEPTYRLGLEAVGEEDWQRALQLFERVDEGSRRDAALYWQAYALVRLRRPGHALARLEELRRRHPSSRWLDDAAALEAELAPERRIEAADRQVQLYAVTALVDADPAQAVQVLGDILAGDADLPLKRQALYVLSRVGSPGARRLVIRVAQESSERALRVAASEYLGLFGDRQALEALDGLLATAEEAEVRTAAVRGYGRAGAVRRLAAVVEAERDPSSAAEAARQLGHLRAGAELRELHSRVSSAAIRRAIADGLAIAEDVPGLLALIAAEPSPEVRRHAVRMLGSAGSGEATRALLDLYRERPDAADRRAVVDGLFRRGDHTALERLARQETDPELRREILRRAKALGAPTNRP